MVEQISMQVVLMSMISVVALICLSFVLYWRLLGEKYMQQKRVQVEARSLNLRQTERCPVGLPTH